MRTTEQQSKVAAYTPEYSLAMAVPTLLLHHQVSERQLHSLPQRAEHLTGKGVRLQASASSIAGAELQSWRQVTHVLLHTWLLSQFEWQGLTLAH